ncbi:MAG: UvrD-helicase domain-containing protein [Acidobacteriota bacterium]
MPEIRDPRDVQELEALTHRVVLASAGTGKTYGLVVRFIALLAAGHAPSSILATTFTRKASGEILERVLRRLAGAADAEDEAATLAAEIGQPVDRAGFRQILATVCRQMTSLNVATLDAFFHQLVSMERWELGLARSQRLAALEESALRPLREAGIDGALASLADSDFEELVHLVARFYKGDAQRSVAWGLDRALVELYDLYREAPESALWDQPRAEELTVLDEADLEALLGRLRQFAPGLQKSLGSAVEAAARQAAGQQWEELLRVGVCKKVLEGDPVYRQQPIEGRLLEDLESLVQHAQRSLLDRLRSQGHATHRIVSQFDRDFRSELESRGIVLFSDLAHSLGQLLPKLSPERWLQLYYRLDGRVQHLLLDEFQDTSLSQWQALQPMVEEILAHADGSHTFYCVGDPKQAIYGWRGGCPELFVGLETRLAAAQPPSEVRSASFRSSQQVLDAVHLVFQGLQQTPVLANSRPLVERWSRAYAQHLRADVLDDLSGYVALKTSPTYEGEFAAHDPWFEALGGRDPASQVKDDDEPVRPTSHLAFAAGEVAGLAARLPEATIGVLVQTNRTVRELLDLLADEGVQASGEGGAPIDDDPAVLAVLSTLRLADHPGDRPSWLHLRSSPWATELLGEAMTEEDPVLLARTLRSQIGQRGLARQLAAWFRRLGPTVDERSRRRLRQLVRLAERFEEDAPTRRLADFVDWVPTSPVSEPEPSRIRVMTVHKAKGLEFDAVVLCELDRDIGRLSNPQVNVLRAEPTASPSAVFRSTNAAVRSGSEALVLANQQELDRRLWDDLSGLYVAMTRARQVLILLVQPLKPTKSGFAKERQSATGILRSTLAAGQPPQELARGGALLFEGGSLPRSIVRGSSTSPEPLESAEPSVLPGRPQDLEASPERSRRLRLVRPSALHARASTVRVGEILGSDETRSREDGVLKHALLAHVPWWTGEPPWSRQQVGEIARRHEVTAERVALLASELAESLNAPELRGLLGRPEGRVQLWRERPFAVPVDGLLIRGTFDRVEVQERRGSVVSVRLLEFKTGSGAPAAAFAQVESYRSALGAMLGVLPLSIEAVVVQLDRLLIARL